MFCFSVMTVGLGRGLNIGRHAAMPSIAQVLRPQKSKLVDKHIRPMNLVETHSVCLSRANPKS